MKATKLLTDKLDQMRKKLQSDPRLMQPGAKIPIDLLLDNQYELKLTLNEDNFTQILGERIQQILGYIQGVIGTDTPPEAI